MSFVAPRLTIRQAHLVINSVSVAARVHRKRFSNLMQFLCEKNYLRSHEGLPRITFANRFDPDLDEAAARVRYGFAIPYLQLIVTKLQPPGPRYTADYRRIGDGSSPPSRNLATLHGGQRVRLIWRVL
ncbi:hypothetical protein PR001_g3836 [Phytophthora rubi]|uniref:Uncharacterized protein n=1 Tax=Phytophthora rubi TaxID=129364 RepID=A0A6A3NYP1_9STRA|nr:hypothetical protein PR001_g3836 [Phytophthora rubi]